MGKLAVIWRSANLLMAIDARSIVEVLPPVSCRPAPGTPDWVRGLFAFRGTLIPLVDAGSLLGNSRNTDRPADRMCNRVLIVHISAPTGPAIEQATWPIGIWVESVLDIEQADFDAAGNHPGFATDAGRFLGPVAQTRWGQVQLVKPQEIFTAEQAAIMTQRLTEAFA